jgi:dienelactone hydrolase
VQFTSDDGTLLNGRLLVPRCEGPHPAIVTVHGSGPGSRYGGTFHTFFLKHGVAVLAYEKRGQTPDGWREPDLAALSADAAAGVRFVAHLPEIDGDRVGLWGSSQGGWVVPAAALDARETSFMILRAGAVVSEAETNLHEVRQEARAEGLDGLDLDSAIDLRREIYGVAMRGEPKSAADAVANPYLQEEWYRIAFGDGTISSLWSDRWWGWAQRNLSVTSAPDVAAFGGPVLWFLGERDEAVPLVSTRAALERAFDESPGDDHEIVVLPDAPHSFLIPSEDGPPHYAEGMFSRTAEWMTERGLTGSCGV